jgi:hypothetical protein
VRQGVEELCRAFAANGLTREEFLGSRYIRIKRIQELQAAGRVDAELRWKDELEPARSHAEARGQ